MPYQIKAGLNILVIGDLMIDHYIYGSCNRISPEAPVPVVEVTSESYTLGGAGNVLKNLKSLTSDADIVSVIGHDENAEIVVEQLSSINIGGDGIIRDHDRCTIMKSRVLATNHQLIRLDREVVTPLSSDKEKIILDYISKAITGHDVVLLSDYNKGLLTPGLIKGIVNICRANNIKTIVDPKGLDFSKYFGVNVIKPNKKEAALATGITIKTKDDLMLACKKIQEITGCDDVIITMSEDGIAFFSGDDLNIMPTKALEVVDVTGAGDTVLASLGVAIASGNSVREACDFANHAAAVVVSKVGSATATLAEITAKYN